MPDEIDYDEFELNKNHPSTDNIHTSFYYNKDIYKNSDKDNYKNNDKITYKQMSAPYKSDEHHPPDKRASFYYDKPNYKNKDKIAYKLMTPPYGSDERQNLKK